MAVNGNIAELRYARRYEKKVDGNYFLWINASGRNPLRLHRTDRHTCGSCGCKVRGAKHSDGTHHSQKVKRPR